MSNPSNGPENGAPPEVVDLQSYRDSFCELALQKQFCNAQELSKILIEFNNFPAFFVYATEILRRRRNNFSIAGNGAQFAAAAKHIDITKNHGQVVSFLKATRIIGNEDEFDACWEILGSHQFRRETEESKTSPEACVQRILKIYRRFRELVGKSAYWSEYKYFEVETIINRSSEPAHDLKFVLDFKLSYKADAAALAAYYADGHKFICHPQFWGKGSTAFSSTPVVSQEELEIREKISRMEHYPPFETQNRIVENLLRIPNEKLRVQIMSLMEVFLKQKIDVKYFEDLVHALVGTKGEASAPAETGNGALTRIIATLPYFEGDDLVIAVFILEDLLKLDEKEITGYVPYFEEKRLEELEQIIYRRKLQEHAAKYPEKPLAEVRQAFTTKEHEESEVPSEEALNTAFALYEKILTAGQELIKLPLGEIMRRLQALCAPFEPLRKKKEKKKEEKEDDDGYFSIKKLPFTVRPDGTIELNPPVADIHENGVETIPESPQPKPPEADDNFKIQFFALVRELFKREFGVYPYNTQLLSIVLMTDENGLGEHKGIYEQIKTGEGKSLILALTSAYFGVQGRRVDVITSNSYLARRDVMKFNKFYKHLGVEAGHFDFQNAREALEENPGIVYTTNHDMIFAYLSCRLNNHPYFDEDRFDVALVDEADNLCIDMGQDSCRIAQEAPGMFDENTLRGFIKFADIHEEAILQDLPTAIAEFQRTYPQTETIHPIYIGLYLRSALHSKKVEENEDYIIKDGQIIIVDVHHTGRLKKKTHWGQGLHEFVTLRNGLKLQPHQAVAAQMNHPSFIQKYRNVYCISGTFGDAIDREEIGEVYDMTGFDIPSHHPSQRVDHTLAVEPTVEQFVDKLKAKIEALNKAERPILILTSSIKESYAVKWFLDELGFRSQLLNDIHNIDADGVSQSEDAIIENAGKAGMITVATSVAGRGADIIPDERAIETGGVHVLLTFVPFNRRVEYQGRGRAGRQGKPGSSEIMACLATDLFIKDLPIDAAEMIAFLIKIYGPDSKEMRKAVEFFRKGMNLIYSQLRMVNLEKDELIDEALERYFARIAGVADSIKASNPILRKHSDATSFIVASYLGDTWITEFDYVETVVKHDNVIAIHRAEKDLVKLEIHPSLQRKLRKSFEHAFGFAIEDIDAAVKDVRFRGVAQQLYGFFEEKLMDIQRRLVQFDRDHVAQMVRALEAKVETAAAACEGKFRTATVVEIKDYLEARKREREKKEEPEDKN